MRNILALILVVKTLSAPAQHEADNWVFGSYTGITFSTNPPSTITGCQIATQEGCSSISDSAGNLLFYTDGIMVWDRNHNMMPNGDSLLGGVSSTQSALIVKHPNNPLYYIFTTTESYNPALVACYSAVDMTLNGGNGDVVEKNHPIINPSTEKITAVKHANGIDYWIIGHELGTNYFVTHLLSDTGVAFNAVTSACGNPLTMAIGEAVGYLKASPDGSKLAAAVYTKSYLEMYDFDNATGMVSNALMLGGFIPFGNTGYYGVEFSPNSSKLYTTVYNSGLIIQYDLSSGNAATILASQDTIATSVHLTVAGLQNAPDGKMYVANFTEPYLSCINNPDSLGQPCNFVDNAITLSTGLSQFGLPNFAVSYFYTPVTNITNPVYPGFITAVYPNPASNLLHVNLNSDKPGSIAIEIINNLGEKVCRTIASSSDNTIDIPLVNFSRGMYLLRIISSDTVGVSKFLVE